MEKSKTNKKLFLSDIDGTLLNNKKELLPETQQALKDFVAGGNTFSICTGRDIQSSLLVYNALNIKLQGSFIVAYNGGMIYDVDNQKTIYRDGIEQGLARKLLDMAKEYDVHVHTYNDHFVLTENYGECMAYYRRVIKTPTIVAECIDEFMDVPPCKIICIELHDHEKQERFRKAVLEKYGDILQLMYSNPYYLELIPKTSGKGNALIRLRDYLGIAPENTIAAGDGENDISMIQAAGIGIAMLNAPESVRKLADYVTPSDNNHAGLSEILYKLI